MKSVDRDADDFRRKVLTISSVDCPAPDPKMVQVLFPHDGPEPLRTIRVARSSSFDQLWCVVVEGVSSPPTWQPPPLRSARDVLRRLYWGTRNAETKYGPPFRLVRPIFDTRSICANNFAHLLIDIVPLCLHARHCIGSDVSFAFDKLGLKASELLSAFAIDPIITHRKIVGPILHIHGTRGFAPYGLHTAFDCPALSFFPDTYRQYEFKATVQYDKVFFARRDARSLENHSDVEHLLSAHGYTTVYMEDFAITDQISIGAHARHVVAIHGAAMGFLALNRGIELLIELSPPHVCHLWFPVALGSRVRKYIIVIPEFDERVVHYGWDAIFHFKNKPFEANLELLEQAVSEVECGARADADVVA